MTIGMLIESLVSKAGALNGNFVDATPFQKSAGKTGDPISSVAEALEKHGFHRHGGERCPGAGEMTGLLGTIKCLGGNGGNYGMEVVGG